MRGLAYPIHPGRAPLRPGKPKPQASSPNMWLCKAMYSTHIWTHPQRDRLQGWREMFMLRARKPKRGLGDTPGTETPWSGTNRHTRYLAWKLPS